MNDVDRSNRRQQPATRVDPITGAVIQGALENIAIEMGHKLMRISIRASSANPRISARR
jgi:N-methylhydantoinase B